MSWLNVAIGDHTQAQVMSWGAEPLPDLFPDVTKALKSNGRKTLPNLSRDTKQSTALSSLSSSCIGSTASSMGLTAADWDKKISSSAASMGFTDNKINRRHVSNKRKRQLDDDDDGDDDDPSKNSVDNRSVLTGVTLLEAQEDAKSRWFNQALNNEKKLVVKDTLLPLGVGQKGLFSSCDFLALDFLCEYRGCERSKSEIDQLYGDDKEDQVAPYALVLSNGAFIDASDPDQSSIARYANDCLPLTVQYVASRGANTSKLRYNAAFVEIAGRLFLRAILPIAEGDEIYVAYGSYYWGTPLQQLRGLIVDHLATVQLAPTGTAATVNNNSATAFEIATAIAERVYLTFGDSSLRWKTLTDLIDTVLNDELTKPYDHALFFKIDIQGQFERSSDNKRYLIKPNIKTRHLQNRIRESGQLANKQTPPPPLPPQ